MVLLAVGVDGELRKLLRVSELMITICRERDGTGRSGAGSRPGFRAFHDLKFVNPLSHLNIKSHFLES